MEEDQYWKYEAVVIEKDNKGHIYLYPDDSTKKPLWLACEASARYLQKLMPGVELCSEYWESVDKTVVVVRNINLKDALENKAVKPTSHIHCLELKFEKE